MKLEPGDGTRHWLDKTEQPDKNSLGDFMSWVMTKESSVNTSMKVNYSGFPYRSSLENTGMIMSLTIMEIQLVNFLM